MSNRYIRQIILPEIGEKGQMKISNASVLCIGAGGLGCPALLYLAAAGIGHIGIVDFDEIDETNLQRQILFTTSQIGKNKAEVAKEKLLSLNPSIKITAYAQELNQENAQNLFENYDIIIDGTDNFSTKFLINDAAIKTGKPYIYGSISGFDGQVSVFGISEAPCYRCLFSQTPKGPIPNCAEAGIIGAVAGIVGITQAMEAIKLIINDRAFVPLIGKIWTIDMHSMETKILSLSKNLSCPTCSKDKKEITLQYSSLICGNIPEVTIDQVKKDTKALIIDVREIDEWNAGHIQSAQHLALSSLMQGNIPNLPADREVYLYCQMGQRSRKAAQIIRDEGYLNVYNVTGGYEAWLKSI